MLDPTMTNLLIKATNATLYMVIISTIFAYLIGLPIGILLYISRDGGIRENKKLYKLFDFIVNILRSIPFLILLIMIMPITKLIVGKTFGPNGTIVPLVFAAAPFVARLVEGSLLELSSGIIEAAQSMGMSNLQIIWKVIIPETKSSLIVGFTIAISTILGYSAMAGAVGGGGLGDVAIQYGYYRKQYLIMYICIVILIIMVQILQLLGMYVSKKLDKR